jgi:hypothetical protein
MSVVDLQNSFSTVFPHDTKTRSNLTKCLKLFEHLLPSVNTANLPSFLEYFRSLVDDRQRYTLHTVMATFVKLNKIAREVRPDAIEQVRQVFRATERDKSTLQTESEQRLEHNNTHVQSFTQTQIQNTVRTLEQSDHPLDKVVLLMIQSGMRMIEVLKLAEVRPGHDEMHITVHNLAKTRDKTQEVEKPLLFTTFTKFTRQLELTRRYVERKTKDKNDHSNTAITNCFNHGVNQRVRKALGGKQYTSHMARKIYGALSYKMFANASKVSLNAWLEHVLGHKTLSTSLSYSNVHISSSL